MADRPAWKQSTSQAKIDGELEVSWLSAVLNVSLKVVCRLMLEVICEFPDLLTTGGIAQPDGV